VLVIRVSTRILVGAVSVFLVFFAGSVSRARLPQEASSTVQGPQSETAKSQAQAPNVDPIGPLPLDLRFTSQTATPLPLASILQKELSKALDALRHDHLDKAQIHLDAAFKISPANPNVDYARGLLADRQGDSSGAQSWWEKSLALEPSSPLAMLALGHILIRKGDLDTAVAYLQQARAIAPLSWRPYALLAVASLARHSYSDAVTYAEHSLELGKNSANAVRLPLAEALIALDRRDASKQVLATFLQAKPPQDQTPVAQHFLKVLQTSPDAFITDAISTSHVSPPAGAKFHFVELPVIPLGYPTWLPSNIDDSIPPVEAGVACPTEEILAGASKNVQKFIQSVDRFTATEILDHELVDNWGLASRRETRKFDYVVEISEISHGYLNVEEYRNGTRDIGLFPDGVATLGLPSIVLLFHPYFHASYELTCEGLGRWRDSEAWQFRFVQRPGKMSLRSYRAGEMGMAVPVSLKGRAWIDKMTLQVVRIESDLVAPLPEIKLAAEHQDVEYAPVKFRDLKESMWLPASADIYFDLRGRKFRRHNTFTDYLLFSVDDKQKISAPKETAASSDTPATQSESAKP
jgi:tetratricopeptide (TPR) repeat protein